MIKILYILVKDLIIMIFITGDIHGLKGLSRFQSSFFVNNVNKKGNYLIITGDCGATWDKKTLKVCKKIYSKFDCTILFVDGNNDNFDILDNLPVENFAGGKVHKITDNLLHLMRGEIYTIEGKTFLAFGGADSYDAPHRYQYTSRKEGKSWWQRECPSKEEFKNALNNLQKHNNMVDYIITHEGTSKYANSFGSEDYDVCHMNDIIKKTANYKCWFAGHHHQNRVADGICCVYDKFITLEIFNKTKEKSQQTIEPNL